MKHCDMKQLDNCKYIFISLTSFIKSYLYV